MRIGLTGGGATVDKIVQQAQQAEADGFTSLWYASSVAGDPLVAMALAGRATTAIELGTAVLQTYPCPTRRVLPRLPRTYRGRRRFILRLIRLTRVLPVDANRPRRSRL